jgi:hypothetical protein
MINFDYNFIAKLNVKATIPSMPDMQKKYQRDIINVWKTQPKRNLGCQKRIN